MNPTTPRYTEVQQYSLPQLLNVTLGSAGVIVAIMLVLSYPHLLVLMAIGGLAVVAGRKRGWRQPVADRRIKREKVSGYNHVEMTDTTSGKDYRAERTKTSR